MSYQVLARKWRPRSFADMVGQTHVLRALTNALDSGRLHHAYLFTGTRGVGKTTLARLLAKAINCEQGVTSTPCGVCTACREIDEGRYVDLIEVDAASRTKVDDTRELLDNVQFAATAGRFKVYLIDEVHMFSNHSFNALLKTLEEPPEHVKFLLATTDPKKLPVTILSRCLQFNLTRLSRQQLAAHLEHVLAEEGVSFEPGALTLIAEAAEGSARDALSLLDQAIAFCGGAVTESEVAAMLGTVRHDQAAGLIEAVLDADGPRLIGEARRLVEAGANVEAAFNEILNLLTRCAVIQFAGAEADRVDGAATDGDRTAALAERLSAEDAQLLYQIALTARRDLAIAPDPVSAFEMALIRMLAFVPAADSGAGTGALPAGAPRSEDRSAEPAAAGPAAAPPDAARPPAQPPAREASAVPKTPAEWAALVGGLGVSGRVRTLAEACAFVGDDGERIVLNIGESHAVLARREVTRELEAALSAALSRPLSVSIEIVPDTGGQTPIEQAAAEQAARQREAEALLEQDEVVRAMKDLFDAEVEAVRPRSSS